MPRSTGSPRVWRSDAVAGTRHAPDRRGAAHHWRRGNRRHLRERRPVRRGGGDVERVARVARAPTGAALSAARVRRGPLPRQVVASARGVRRRRARGRERGGGGRAAVSAVGGRRVLLLGFSMGGAVAISAADEPSVERVLGLAPWIPDRLSLGPLRGKRLDVLHGSLDRWLPGIPGVSPDSSRRGFERARALGVPGTYEVIPGALHGVALRAHWGPAVPLPRAAAWERHVAAQLA